MKKSGIDQIDEAYGLEKLRKCLNLNHVNNKTAKKETLIDSRTEEVAAENYNKM
ncbi:MAG: hypothetical protein K2L46_02585 [Paramuribaculum sp.]|nr:hypothetical protein [Paramuribaculum sp.]